MFDHFLFNRVAHSAGPSWVESWCLVSLQPEVYVYIYIYMYMCCGPSNPVCCHINATLQALFAAPPVHRLYAGADVTRDVSEGCKRDHGQIDGDSSS